MATSSGNSGKPAPPPPPDRPGRCNTYNPKTGRYCGRPQGWGTGYKIGPCRVHGGMLPRVRRRAAEETYHLMYAGKIMFGRRLDTDPMVGILDVVAEYAGFAAYVKAELAATADEEGRIPLLGAVLTAGGGARDITHPTVTLWMDVLDRYAKACKMAGDLGVEQTKIDLVSSYQERVLDILENVLRAAGLDPDDPHIAELVSGQLALVAGPSAA